MERKGKDLKRGKGIEDFSILHKKCCKDSTNEHTIRSSKVNQEALVVQRQHEECDKQHSRELEGNPLGDSLHKMTNVRSGQVTELDRSAKGISYLRDKVWITRELDEICFKIGGENLRGSQTRSDLEADVFEELMVGWMFCHISMAS